MRPCGPTHLHALMDIDSLDMSPQTTDVPNDLGVYVTEAFPEDVRARARDEHESENLPSVCPLCATLDDPDGNTPNAETARRIIEFEQHNHCRLPDDTIFTQIASAYNAEIVRPARDLALSNSGMSVVEVPIEWSRMVVARHFKECKLLPRRKLVHVLVQAERIMDLTYANCRQRNAATGEIRCDPVTTKMWWAQVRCYTDLVLKSRSILEGGEGGTGTQLKKKSVASQNMWKGMM